MGRMNFLFPPFDNVKVRRAALLAMNQKDVLDALVGNPEYFQTCGAIFVCGTPLATDVGSEAVVKGTGMAEAKKELAASGYDGTPVVIMAPGDVVSLKAQPIVAAQLLRQAGFKVDLQATDWNTIISRRTSQKPPSEGGWNMFFTNWVGADLVNPAVNFPVGGRGKNGGWFGWAEDPQVEKLKLDFAHAQTLEDQKKVAAEIQQEVYDQVLYLPLGQFVQPSAWRKSITGVLDGPATPIFWNMDKTE
jgi:peptide/nickel transport system substrate-binding protein